MTDGDNRMAFPDAPERQSTAVRKLLTHEPQTASEIAACFQGGERNVRAVIEVLEAEQAQGRAALVDWGWTFAEPDIERHRPLRTMQYWQIDAISAHYEKHSKLDKDMKDSDWRELISLLVELGLRKGTRAKRLRQRIADRLAISGAVPRLAPGLLKMVRAETATLPDDQRAEAQARLFEGLRLGTNQLSLPDPEDKKP